MPVGAEAKFVVRGIPSVPLESAQIHSTDVRNSPVDGDCFLVVVMAETGAPVQFAANPRRDSQQDAPQLLWRCTVGSNNAAAPDHRSMQSSALVETSRKTSARTDTA